MDSFSNDYGDDIIINVMHNFDNDGKIENYAMKMSVEDGGRKEYYQKKDLNIYAYKDDYELYDIFVGVYDPTVFSKNKVVEVWSDNMIEYGNKKYILK